VAHELSELAAAAVAPRCSALASTARAREGNGGSGVKGRSVLHCEHAHAMWRKGRAWMPRDGRSLNQSATTFTDLPESSSDDRLTG
jgi:hypothetical protein